MGLAIEVRQALELRCALGEGVVWDAARGRVWFVDIKLGQLWWFDPDSGDHASAPAPGQIGWALPAENGLLLCGIVDALYTFDPGSGAFSRLAAVPGERAGNRLNDACTDPWGRVWFGSMDDGENETAGRFYVFEHGVIHAAGPQGITITNGPAVSRGGERIYFTDTGGQRILQADLSAAGVGEARPFVSTADDFPDAFPDGPVVDAEDHLWTGLYKGGGVARYSPDGELVAFVAAPARDITKMAFGGADYSTCYLTSATKDMSVADMARQPQAGSLFAFEAPVKGFAQSPAKLG